MNKTQKCAWFCLTLTMLLLIFSVIVYGGIIAVGKPTRITSGLFYILFLIIALCFRILLWKKQSPVEVDLDERDQLIKRRAVFACYISLWALLIAACTIPWFIVGPEGSIPVCVLPATLFGVFIIVMLVHSVAILIQYGRGGKGEKS